MSEMLLTFPSLIGGRNPAVNIAQPMLLKSYMDKIIRADRIILPEGTATGTSLVVRGGIIADIVPSFREPGQGEVIDAGNAIVAPPFCDYHLHFSKYDTVHTEEAASRLTGCGILGAFEGGAEDDSGFYTKRALREKLVIRACGTAIYRKGTYGRAIGRPVASLSDAEGLIDLLENEGADYVKVINSGIFLPDKGIISPGGFEAADLSEIIALARQRGLPVFCHANGDDAIRAAVLAGATAIIHGFFIADETLPLMAEAGASLIPTINALHSLSRLYTDPEATKNILNAVSRHLETIAKAITAGVSVLPGSDAGPPYIPLGQSFLEELIFFGKANLSFEQIVAAAALRPLKKGTRADFLLLEGLRPKSVFVAGEMSCASP